MTSNFLIFTTDSSIKETGIISQCFHRETETVAEDRNH